MKYTTEQFREMLNAFNENNTVMMNNAVCLVTSRGLWSELCADISDYHKQSLVRKVLRYVAQTALRGTMEIDGLSQSCNFHEMQDGESVSFGTDEKWSFHSHRTNSKVVVEVNGETAKFYNEDHVLLMETEIWDGCHWYTATGRIDLMHYFDDVRNLLVD